MPKKQKIDDLLRKNLGTEVANQVIRQINKMIKAGASPGKIQKAVAADLIMHVQEQAAIAVVAKTYPSVEQKIGTGNVLPILTFIVPFLPSGPLGKHGVKGAPPGGRK